MNLLVYQLLRQNIINLQKINRFCLNPAQNYFKYKTFQSQVDRRTHIQNNSEQLFANGATHHLQQVTHSAATI
jgi:hypothetical protein